MVALSKTLLNSIESHLLQVSRKDGVLDIYRCAQAIQVENPTDNVALEDIMEYIVKSSSNFALEFTWSWATQKVSIEDHSQEFLINVEVLNA